jgi:hypothetical protein
MRRRLLTAVHDLMLRKPSDIGCSRTSEAPHHERSMAIDALMLCARDAGVAVSGGSLRLSKSLTVRAVVKNDAREEKADAGSAVSVSTWWRGGGSKTNPTSPFKSST